MRGIYNSNSFAGDTNVRVGAGAMIEVRHESNNAIAVIYDGPDDDDAQLANPFAANGDGSFSFHADAVAMGYKVSSTFEGQTVTARYQPIGNAQYYDVEDLTALFQDESAVLAAISALTYPSSTQLLYFGGSPVEAHLSNLTAFALTLLDDANSAEARQTLGLVINSDVQAYSARLGAFAALSADADRGLYFSGSPFVLATFALTTFARSVLDDPDAATARATLGLTIGSNVQAYSAMLSAIAALPAEADRGLYFSGSPVEAALYTLSAFARTLLDDASASAMRSTLGLVIGTDVQAFNAVLSTPVGKHAVWIPASAMTARSTSGAAALATTAGAANQPDVSYVAFDGGSPQQKLFAGFTIRMPKSYNEGAVTAAFSWRRASGTGAANVVLGVRAVPVRNNDTPVQNFGADATVTAPASTVAATNIMHTPETGSIQIGAGSPPNAESLVFFEVFRDKTSASDTLGVDVHLIGVTIYITTDALTDD